MKRATVIDRKKIMKSVYELAKMKTGMQNEVITS